MEYIPYPYNGRFARELVGRFHLNLLPSFVPRENLFEKSGACWGQTSSNIRHLSDSFEAMVKVLTTTSEYHQLHCLTSTRS